MNYDNTRDLQKDCRPKKRPTAKRLTETATGTVAPIVKMILYKSLLTMVPAGFLSVKRSTTSCQNPQWAANALLPYSIAKLRIDHIKITNGQPFDCTIHRVKSGPNRRGINRVSTHNTSITTPWTANASVRVTQSRTTNSKIQDTLGPSPPLRVGLSTR